MKETDATFADMIKSGNVDGVRAAVAEDPSLLSAVIDMDATAIPLAIYQGQREVAESLREAKGKLTIHEAIVLGDLHEVRRNLAEEKELIEAFSEDGFTPLCLAAYLGHREILDDLLRAGANPNVRSKNDLDVMPLHSALANGHKEIARALLEAGADVKAPGGGGWSPLHYAAHSNDIETAKALLDRGAEASATRDDGLTPIQTARDRGHLDLAVMLEVSVKKF